MRRLGLPSCEDVSFLVSQAHDRPLGPGERWKTRLHVAMCQRCSRFRQHLRTLHTAIRSDKQQLPSGD
ncbi:MAG: anti-sigma factor family protein [Casimicrobiaceae bacterium]